MANWESTLCGVSNNMMSRSSLHKCMKNIGFKYKKENNRTHLLELPNIRLKRLAFLRKYQQEKEDNNFEPVFLDETWVFSKGGDRRVWQDGSKSTECKKSGSGVRYIIVHAGNNGGFIENASLIFRSNKKTGDYHDNMNRANFEKWFKTQLIPNLEQPSLIIMDNASYHSGLDEEIPRKSWTKQHMLEWLLKKSVKVPDNAFKDRIWETVQQQTMPKKIYHLDNYAESHGHRVLRLPPYHCQYNAIELVWSECKRNFNENVTTINSSPEAVVNLWDSIVKGIPKQHWINYIKHTENVIQEAWETEKKLNTLEVEPMIIDVSDDSTDSSSESDY